MTQDHAKTAFFWDESFLWGIIAYRTFRELDISFDLITAADIHDGALAGYDILFVPGGWASDKIVALGEKGRLRIREFVGGGGSYLGICGGAGLALSHGSGLALAPVTRMSRKVRVPSFSGAISLDQSAPDHPMWRNVADGAAFQAWWPGQFALEGSEGIEVLARYAEPGDDAFVTDLPILPHLDWEIWEKRYGINLDPKRLKGEPAVIETRFGEGRVLLSYLHFETPGDGEGHKVLRNILDYLAGGKPLSADSGERGADEADGLPEPAATCGCNPKAAAVGNDARFLTEELRESAAELIEFGKKNHLWFERNDWILQWRRGVRGVEYSTLDAMLIELAAAVKRRRNVSEKTMMKLRRLYAISQPFFQDAPHLLLLERDAMSRGPISPLKADDPQINSLREKLFSSSRRCGGLYKEIVDLADEILLSLYRG